MPPLPSNAPNAAARAEEAADITLRATGLALASTRGTDSLTGALEDPRGRARGTEQNPWPRKPRLIWRVVAREKRPPAGKPGGAGEARPGLLTRRCC